MPPKDPKKLREQVEDQQDKPAEEGYEWSAEGAKVRTPHPVELENNLRKLARSRKR